MPVWKHSSQQTTLLLCYVTVVFSAITKLNWVTDRKLIKNNKKNIQCVATSFFYIHHSFSLSIWIYFKCINRCNCNVQYTKYGYCSRCLAFMLNCIRAIHTEGSDDVECVAIQGYLGDGETVLQKQILCNLWQLPEWTQLHNATCNTTTTKYIGTQKS